MSSTLTADPAGPRSRLLPWLSPVAIVAIAQLFGTSLWFSANGAVQSLMSAWHATAADIGGLANFVQLGFILDTLSLSLSGAADRFRASKLFVSRAIASALFNLCFAWLADGRVSGAVLRFCVGVKLAGIYPMGMKLIVGWAPERIELALAQLVSMLTLGTALPHVLRLISADWPWQVQRLIEELQTGSAQVVGTMDESRRQSGQSVEIACIAGQRLTGGTESVE